MLGAPFRPVFMGGRSSGVERNLAKVEVVGSNPIARSIIFKGLADLPQRGKLFRMIEKTFSTTISLDSWEM